MKKIFIVTLSLLLLTGCYSQTDYDRNYNNGYDTGYREGYNEGYEKGESVGYNGGLMDGYDDGYSDGRSDGESVSYYGDGYIDGYIDVVYFYESPNGFDSSIIPMLTVDSSFIDSIGYSPRYKVLLIAMNGKDLYAYYNVNSSVFYNLSAADSPGSYFNEHIKSQYEYQKLV